MTPASNSVVSLKPGSSPVNERRTVVQPFQHLCHLWVKPVETGLDFAMAGCTRLKPGVHGRGITVEMILKAGSNN
jgi:hypothetical protein